MCISTDRRAGEEAVNFEIQSRRSLFGVIKNYGKDAKRSRRRWFDNHLVALANMEWSDKPITMSCNTRIIIQS